MISQGPGATSLDLKWNLFNYKNLPNEPNSVLPFALGPAWPMLLHWKKSPYEVESWEDKAWLDIEEPSLGFLGVLYPGKPSLGDFYEEDNHTFQSKQRNA